MERPTWDLLASGTPLDRLVGILNQRFPRWSDLIARLQRQNTRSATAATTLTEGDDLVLVATAGGAFSVTLPPAANTRGVRFTIKKTDASANNVTLDGNGAETIDGAATLAWNTQWLAYTVVSNGTAWFTV